MKTRGGYSPKLPGRPSSIIHGVATPGELGVDLTQGGQLYVPAVASGERVAFGQTLAWHATGHGRIGLPAPAAGTVTFAADARQLALTVTDAAVAPVHTKLDPARTTADTVRARLAEGGVWPLLWSSQTGGLPALDGTDVPRRIIVNCVTAEPFRARGRVILQDDWDVIAAGIRFLPRLLAEYGVIHLVLTDLADPIAVIVRTAMAGHAWVHIESVPVRYPVEHPEVLARALRTSKNRVRANESLWVMDVQAVKAIGALLDQGLPPYERIVAVGGPGVAAPSHRRVRIGTRLDALLEPRECADHQLVLRGGIFRGEPVTGKDSIGYADDGFFVLPRTGTREFLGFVTPGGDRRSVLPCFLTALSNGSDRQMTATLRGERRPCIACGLCERVCPADLLPQVLHRYLYRDALDEAEAAGLGRCIGCGLCSYVCPSKLELVHQFAEARDRIAHERAEAAAADAERNRREESKKHEQEHSEDWRQ